jgi:DNA-binding transcriptional MerR regulator
MGWSTRTLAELAGTTLRTVRHYHELGLLPEPERSVNGYKQYGVVHLARLVRIRRLVDLGMTLPQIAELDESLEPDQDELRLLHGRLVADIARLQAAREDLERYLGDLPLGDLPSGLAFAEADDSLPATDRQVLLVLSRILEPEEVEVLAEYRRAVPFSADELALELLPADADEPSRQELADRLLPVSLEVRRRWPQLPDLVGPRAPRGLRVALEEIYNPAQLDVMERLVVMRQQAQE